MTEAYENTNPFNLESLSDAISNNDGEGCRKEITSKVDISNLDNSNLPLDDNSRTEGLAVNNATKIESEGASNSTMNWQKVAHKLREYNRKLLKKVFRLEQELSDTENKIKKQLEKARTSDILVAQQESEIKKYQEQLELFDRKLATFQETTKQKESRINTLSEQYQFSQRQTAKLERQCTLLKEYSDRQVYDLNAKEKQVRELQIELEKQQQLAIQYKTDGDRQIEELSTKDKQLKELKTKLERQQRLAIQYKAELQRDRKTVTTIPHKSSDIQHQSDRRTIKPWSNSSNSDPKISLPKTTSLPLAGRKNRPSETVKTAAEIATWTASQVKLATQNKAKKEVAAKSSAKSQPKSLAAIDLPTFPKQR